MYRSTLTHLMFALATTPAGAEVLLPDFSPTDFSPGTTITHPYFPIMPGKAAKLEARGADDGGAYDERSELAYAGIGPTILDVATVAQRDMAYEGGRLVEETLDYYAQDGAGNVWYMGEDVTNYHYDDTGTMVATDHASAWRAGVNGALPGFMMAADPKGTGAYFQEHAPADEAMDQAVFHELLSSLQVGARMYQDVIVIFETNPLDPDARDLKFYAPGIGLIREEEGVDDDFADPERVFDLVEVK